MAVEEHNIEIDGLTIRYLTAGEGRHGAVHGAGDNARDWAVGYAPPGSHPQVTPRTCPAPLTARRPAADYSPAFFERFVAAFGTPWI